MIERGKASPTTKARVKKAATAEKKLIKQQEKLWQKERAKSKDQGLQMKKLALRNCRVAISNFKVVLSDPIVPSNKELLSADPNIKDLVAAQSSTIKKKKAALKTLIHRLGGRAVNKTPTQSNSCSSTLPPPPAIELICLGKQKVRIFANAVENISCKQMHRQNGANY